MSALVDTNALDSVNPSLTRYGRRDPAPVLPLREEPDLLSWLETSGRLVADEESGSPEVSTVEEEELSALMGEKEDYNKDDEQNGEQWEDRRSPSTDWSPLSDSPRAPAISPVPLCYPRIRTVVLGGRTAH